MTLDSGDRPSAFLFDLDGVIVDTRAIVRANWLRFTAAIGLPLDEKDLPRIYGRRTIDILVDVFGVNEEAAHAAAAHWIDARAGEIVDVTLPIVSGAPVFVRAAAADGIPIALASSAVAANVSAALRRAGLAGVFGAVVTAEDVAHGKPAPDAYLQASAALGVDPGRAVVFEDTPAGIDAGHAAGAFVVAITTTLERADLGAADLVLPDFRNLTPGALMGRLIGTPRTGSTLAETG